MAASTVTVGPNPSTNCSGEPYPPKVEKTATATPNTAPTWRIVLLTPEATPSRVASADRITAVAIVGNAVATPMPATNRGTISVV